MRILKRCEGTAVTRFAVLLRYVTAPCALLFGALGAYVLLLFIATVVASYWPLPPSWIALPNELAPVLFFPAPILLIVALAAKTRGAILLSAIPILLFAVLYGPRYVPTPPAAADPQQQEIVVYSANLARQRRVDLGRVTDLMAQEQPDVVAVQELSTSGDALIAVITASLPYHTLVPRPDWTGGGVWSRYPIVDAEVLKLDDEGVNLSQRVRIDVRGQIVTVYNVHLNAPVRSQWEPTPNLLEQVAVYDARVRRRQVEALLADVQAQRGPLVLAGDFNLTDRTYDYRRLAERLTDGYASVGRGVGLTFPSREGRGTIGRLVGRYVRIDYVWTAAGARPREMRVVDSVGSDHHGLMARIALPAGS